MKRHLFTLFAVFFLLTACSTPDPMSPTSGNDLHLCDNNEQVIISLSDKGDYAGLVAHGKNIILPRIESEADAAVFENEIYTLYYEMGTGVLERDGTPYLVGCTKS
jgi:hypothetical protein